ncbi:MAG TPA: nucleoside deaminase [Pseudogracilibacillus sp.]|nr:nucleoside deaminase [Pseudogracilibacillus sp.]
MNKFMERAVQLAVDNVRAGGDPFGAVLVKDCTIISEGVNELHKHYDVSGHAELLAIRRAQQKAQTNDLSGYTMYASGEPCPMCLSAMYFAGITDVYYSQSVSEAVEVGLDRSKIIYDDLKKVNEEREIVKKQMPLQEDQENPMKEWDKL